MAKRKQKFKYQSSPPKNTRPASGTQNTSTQQNILKTALSLHQAGRLAQAEIIYRQILLAEPNNPDALHFLGMLAHQTGRNDVAEELINKALSIQPNYLKAYNNLGVILMEQGRIEESISCYHQALILKPDYAEAYNNLGNALKKKGKTDKAVNNFRQALILKPYFAEASYNLGLTLMEQGELDEAVNNFRQALSLKPDYVDALYYLGNALEDLGRRNEAIACYRHVLTVKQDFVEAYVNLGITLSKQEKLDEAAACFRKALSLKPNQAEMHYNLGNALKNMGKLDEAAECLYQALALKPDKARMLHDMGVIFRELGKMDDAIVCFKKALSLNPHYVLSFKGLTSIVRYTKVDDQIREMEELYNKTYIPTADRIDIGFALGKVFEDLGKYNKSFDFIFEANKLKRNTFKYSIQEDHDLFERIKKTFSTDFFTSHHELGSQDKTPIFILGMPRSGTTLVEQILASHSLVFGAGELQVLANIINGVCTVDTINKFPECLLDFTKTEFERMGSDYIEKIREHSKEAVFITDKMPTNYIYVGLIKTVLPSAKVIHCVRDPMDNCYSIFKKDFLGKYSFAYDLVELGRYYNSYCDLMTHWERVLPRFMFTLKYENLILDQLNQTKKLVDFCGLPWEDACLKFHKTDRRVSTASFAQVRQPIYADSIELWRRYEKQLKPLWNVIFA